MKRSLSCIDLTSLVEDDENNCNTNMQRLNNNNNYCRPNRKVRRRIQYHEASSCDYFFVETKEYYHSEEGNNSRGVIIPQTVEYDEERYHHKPLAFLNNCPASEALEAHMDMENLRIRNKNNDACPPPTSSLPPPPPTRISNESLASSCRDNNIFYVPAVSPDCNDDIQSFPNNNNAVFAQLSFELRSSCSLNK